MNALERTARDLIRYWIFPVLRPRRFHVYGTGMPKTGTTSLAAIFGNYRSLHEPDFIQFMQIIVARAEGTVSDRRAAALVRGRLRRLWIECNSSWLNYFLLDLLLAEHPQAKFILTIRDCYSWMDSAINHLLARPLTEFELQSHQKFAGEFLRDARHCDGDRILAERGLWPLDAWLRMWSAHNAHVVATVPAERLLVVRTQDISTDIPRIADFVGLPSSTLDTKRSYQYRAAKKYSLLSEIDPDYLLEQVALHCGDLMQRVFPEIKGLSDVPGYRAQDLAQRRSA